MIYDENRTWKIERLRSNKVGLRLIEFQPISSLIVSRWRNLFKVQTCIYILTVICIGRFLLAEMDQRFLAMPRTVFIGTFSWPIRVNKFFENENRDLPPVQMMHRNGTVIPVGSGSSRTFKLNVSRIKLSKPLRHPRTHPMYPQHMTLLHQNLLLLNQPHQWLHQQMTHVVKPSLCLVNQSMRHIFSNPLRSMLMGLFCLQTMKIRFI